MVLWEGSACGFRLFGEGRLSAWPNRGETEHPFVGESFNLGERERVGRGLGGCPDSSLAVTCPMAGEGPLSSIFRIHLGALGAGREIEAPGVGGGPL